MSKFVSIQTKLTTLSMLLIGATFVCLLSTAIILNIITLDRNIQKSKKSIRNALMAKGKTLVRNNSIAIQGLAADNAFTAIRELVASTVADDPDMAYGIYMDHRRVPWVLTTLQDTTNTTLATSPLDDSLSLWASTLRQPSSREFGFADSNIIEFAAPVIADDNTMGWIRYGISTRSMQHAIKETLADGRYTRNISIIIHITMGLISLFIWFLLAKRLTLRITRPVASLVDSSRLISEGNYDISVIPQSNDEIGDLAIHFEKMRVTIKKYTGHLQDLINEKMQQVHEILNNIDQGLFTINLDGSVNNEYSARANTILRVEDVASCGLRMLFRLDARQEKSFMMWLALIQKSHKRQRWIKLERLCPFRRIELSVPSEEPSTAYISISYQPVYDKNGDLLKIMVLAVDETEKRLKDIQMVAERLRHENDVKTILSIANTPAEEISEFMEDTTARMRALHLETTSLLDSLNREREIFPDKPSMSISSEQIDRIYRDLHTIKGNSGSYGFEVISRYAHDAENFLEKLREPAEERRSVPLTKIAGLLDKVDGQIADIRGKIKLIFGDEEELIVRLPQTHINSIVKKSIRLRQYADDDRIKDLLSECIMLSWKPLKTILRKYEKMAMKTARKLHKNIIFIITNETIRHPFDIVTDLDDVFIHLIRNSVAHGIEETEVREELGKGVGRIRITLDITEKSRIITITDDGKGIDFAKLAENAVEKNIVSREEADRLLVERESDLLYLGHISTSRTITDISGRGMGMRIVRDKINSMKGTFAVDSWPGKGTTFRIEVPVCDQLPERSL